MIPLETQEQFETLIKTTDLEKPNPEEIVIYFTASWCRPCSRLDWTKILEQTSSKIVWYKCDVDVNDYTLGYCFPPDQRKMPSFVCIKNSTVSDKFNTSDTDLVISKVNVVFQRSALVAKEST